MSGDPGDLAKLNDLAIPSPIPWWPPAPGWWLIAGGIFAIAMVLLSRAAARYRANAYRRAALRELDAIERAVSAGTIDPQTFAVQLSSILKRAALVAFPRDTVAPLTGMAWLQFLDRVAGMTIFSGLVAPVLTGIAFRRDRDAEPVHSDTLTAAARQWLRRHRAN